MGPLGRLSRPTATVPVSPRSASSAAYDGRPRARRRRSGPGRQSRERRTGGKSLGRRRHFRRPNDGAAALGGLTTVGATLRAPQSTSHCGASPNPKSSTTVENTTASVKNPARAVGGGRGGARAHEHDLNHPQIVAGRDHGRQHQHRLPVRSAAGPRPGAPPASTYHLARKPRPPTIGNPSNASMQTLMATASQGRAVQRPA